MPQAGPLTLETFAGDCTTPKSVFNLQDTDLTVCAKFTNAVPGWSVIWSNANGVAVQTSVVTAADSTATFTLTPASSLGDWRVILFEPFGASVFAVTPFTVIDAENPRADLSVSKAPISSSVSSGGQVLFTIQVTNHGPSAASAVELTDSVPSNTTFVSFDQIAGPVFSCTNPLLGETGNTVCSIVSLERGETAFFVAAYQVGAVPNDTIISNTASVTSSTPDPAKPGIPDNNTASAEVTVTSAPCQLSTPENITVDADPGQAGAVVTYATPTGTGDCGTPTTGEDGEPIPAISCNPPSGSFFPAGTTTVICTAMTGPAVSFQVTVNNPGALTISLHGDASLTIECGQPFSDPGATAIDGAGQPLEVTVAYTGAFNTEAPAAGTYTATYTATEGANSVSTNRTIIVEDTVGPAITIEGANPYKIQQGSCNPFVDPGASAFDTCAGPKPVSSSISGPGGATAVDPNIPGTYIVTYTATDGTHESTATRTVIVGNFPPDEVDQPGGSNVPPTLTVNGDAEITLECGTPFTDPGATATVCGSPVQVTTSGSVDVHTPGIYSITYSATANGFTVEATRIVTVEPDTTAPVITLNGASTMTVECHTSFTDPGATAHDACAGDLAVTTSGTVDVNTPGSYTLTYTATDPSGHTQTATRTVNVVDTTGPTAPFNNLTIFLNNLTIVFGQNTFTVNGTTYPFDGISCTHGGYTFTFNGQTVTISKNGVSFTYTFSGKTLVLWTPTRQYQTVKVSDLVAGATDGCDPNVNGNSVVISEVTSDEPEDMPGGGDGNTLNDIVIAPDCKSVQLRAERNVIGNGRVYTITMRVTDASGNTTTVTSKLKIRALSLNVVDNGPQYTVNGTCP
jgi:uncharacterized repeat protein (TIGR01451 family)